MAGARKVAYLLGTLHAQTNMSVVVSHNNKGLRITQLSAQRNFMSMILLCPNSLHACTVRSKVQSHQSCYRVTFHQAVIACLGLVRIVVDGPNATLKDCRTQMQYTCST